MPTAAELVMELNDAFGEGTVRLGNDPDLQVRYWTTGVLPFDYLLNGGLPTGRFVEVFGDYSTLKSYLALKSIASVQSLGGAVALVDTEHAYDPEWAAALGVDVDALALSQPETAEEGIKVMETLARSHHDLVVWDSIAASQPKQYREAAPGEDLAPAGLARVMSAGLRRLNSANKKTCIFAINQTRINVGMTYGGARETNPGGKSMPFYASYRVRLTKAGKITDDVKVHDGEKLVPAKRTTGIKIKASLEKSKLSRPFSETWFIYSLETGQVDDAGFLLSQGLERGLITESNARFTIPGVMDSSVHGKPKFKQFMHDNPEVIEWLKSEVMPESPAAFPGGQSEPAKKKGTSRKRGSSKS